MSSNLNIFFIKKANAQNQFLYKQKKVSEKKKKNKKKNKEGGLLIAKIKIVFA